MPLPEQFKVASVLCRLTDGCCKLLSCRQVVSNWVLMTKRAMFICPVFSSLLLRCRVKVKPCSELIQNFIEPICVKLYILVAFELLLDTMDFSTDRVHLQQCSTVLVYS